MNILKTRRYFIIFSIIAASILVTSSVGYYVNSRKQTEIVHERRLYAYTNIGEYSYNASLYPNLIYNVSYLLPGQGLIYSEITNLVRVDFEYRLSSGNPISNLVIEKDHYFVLESPDKWRKEISFEDAEKYFNYSSDSRSLTFYFNETLMSEIVNTIDYETGLRSSRYNLVVRNEVTVTASINQLSIDDYFEPELTITVVKGGETGSVIEFSSLRITDNNEITRYEKEVFENVKNRKTWYLGSIILSLFLLSCGLIRVMNIKTKLSIEMELQKIIEPHKEIITTSIESPPITRNIVIYMNFEDLVKTSEMIGKPIIREKDSYLFYLLDSDTLYKFEYTQISQ